MAPTLGALIIYLLIFWGVPIVAAIFGGGFVAQRNKWGWALLIAGLIALAFVWHADHFPF